MFCFVSLAILKGGLIITEQESLQQENREIYNRKTGKLNVEKHAQTPDRHVPPIAIFLFPTKKSKNSPVKLNLSAKFTNILKVHRQPPYFRPKIFPYHTS
jgi:hypothetical protein